MYDRNEQQSVLSDVKMMMMDDDGWRRSSENLTHF
jgi:hypothetical protein